MSPDIVTLGEPLVEFNVVEAGGLQFARRYEQGWGGDVSNFAIAVNRLGGSAGIMCRLGDDAFGRNLLDLWEAERVDTSTVIRDPGAQTGIYFISRDGESHSFTYYRKGSAASRFKPEDIPAGYIQQAKVFHGSGISQAISDNACDAVFRAIELARGAGVLISYDPNVRTKLWSKERARAIVLESIGLADIVFPSMEDAALLTGLEEPEEIASRLLARGPRLLALKLGPGGVLLATPDGMQRIPAYSVEVVDTTGAGDTFDAAFMVATLEGRTAGACAQFAIVAAALACTGKGAVGPIPTRGQVDAILPPAPGEPPAH